MLLIYPTYYTNKELEITNKQYIKSIKLLIETGLFIALLQI